MLGVWAANCLAGIRTSAEDHDSSDGVITSARFVIVFCQVPEDALWLRLIFPQTGTQDVRMHREQC